MARNSWNGGTFLGDCENLRTPVITSVTSKKFLERREEYLAVCQRGLRPTSKTVYTDDDQGKQDKVKEVDYLFWLVYPVLTSLCNCISAAVATSVVAG